VAEAAQAAGVKDMVLVSTDKAVHPHNVMGATKRLAELVLQSLAAERQGGTRYTIVRFGNVLTSSGSVVPLSREQIRHGGPVTVIHRDVTRYFMSIREAASMVIQAGALSSGGEVYVLDMGKPVKILVLARRMVRLQGFTVRDEASPEGDIAIDFIGLRPGEKLHEALFYGADVRHTAHPMIMQTAEPSVPWKDLSAMLDEFHRAVEGFDYARATRVLCRSIRGSGMDREAYNQLAGRLEASLNEAHRPQLNGPAVRSGEGSSRAH
jgi:FlaA1/EpsC-like NDP-sugar epimerase